MVDSRCYHSEEPRERDTERESHSFPLEMHSYRRILVNIWYTAVLFRRKEDCSRGGLINVVVFVFILFYYILSLFTIYGVNGTRRNKSDKKQPLYESIVKSALPRVFVPIAMSGWTKNRFVIYIFLSKLFSASFFFENHEYLCDWLSPSWC